MNNDWKQNGIIIGPMVQSVFSMFMINSLFPFKKFKNIDVQSKLKATDELSKKKQFREALALNLEVLNQISEKKDPRLFGHVLLNTGTCYFQIGFKENDEKAYIEAIEYFKKALNYFNIDKYPEFYATTQFYMGRALLIMYNKTNEITYGNDSVIAFKNALKIRNKIRYPKEFALINYHLGNIRLEIANTENRKENLLSAIEAYSLSLQISSNILTPKENADIFMNMGYAYIALSNIEKSKYNALLAVKTYVNAINSIQSAEDSDEYAGIISNLGAAYNRIFEIQGDPIFLDKSLDILNQAQILCEAHGFKNTFEKTSINIGNSKLYLGIIKKNIGLITEAIQIYHQSMSQLSRENQDKYSMLNYSLGNAYLRLYEIDNIIDTLTKSIQYYEIAYKYKDKLQKNEIMSISNNYCSALVVHSEAIGDYSNLKKCLSILDNAKSDAPFEAYKYNLGSINYNLGRLYLLLYKNQSNLIFLRKSIEAFNEAMKSYDEDGYEYDRKNIIDQLEECNRLNMEIPHPPKEGKI